MLVAGRQWAGNAAIVDRPLTPPIFVGQGAQVTGSFTNLVPPLPLGWSQGDIFFLVMMASTSGGDLPPTAGWAFQSGLSIFGTRVEIHWRLATPSTVPPVCNTSSWIGSCSASILAFRNVRQLVPFEGFSLSDQSSAGATQLYGSITPTGLQRLVCNLFINDVATGIPDTGWLEQIEFAGSSPNSRWQLDTKVAPTAILTTGTHTLSEPPFTCHRCCFALVPFGG